MEKETNQELEWLEAQKIEISVDLLAAAKQQLQFLQAIDRNRWLYDGPALEKAIYRYNAYWLPLLAKYNESSSICEGPLVPPLDCEWVWHCHRLNPVRYKSDCEQFYGRVLDNSGVASSVNGNCKLQTEAIWKTLYPMEPFDIDLDKEISEPVLEKCTTYDLVSAVKRQSPFYYQVSRAHVDNDVFLQEAIARYKAFLYLIKRNRERNITLFCVPTYDIDLIWHTHQLHALSYYKDLKNMIGRVLEHDDDDTDSDDDDTDSDRSTGKKLDTGFSRTTSQWEETFGRGYWKAGAMNRGRKSIGEDEESQNVIQFPEVKVIEVILEIVGIKNLPDTHKGKVSVMFSKTQDSLFNVERRLTILSESCGKKQVAMFQCEPRGELSLKLMSSKSKTLGLTSLSLSEFLFPVTKLSVEKWLKFTDDPNPISLRVAVSFTPPVMVVDEMIGGGARCRSKEVDIVGGGARCRSKEVNVVGGGARCRSKEVDVVGGGARCRSKEVDVVGGGARCRSKEVHVVGGGARCRSKEVDTVGSGGARCRSKEINVVGGGSRCRSKEIDVVGGGARCRSKEVNVVDGGARCRSKEVDIVDGGARCRSKEVDVVGGGARCRSKEVDVVSGGARCRSKEVDTVDGGCGGCKVDVVVDAVEVVVG